jgi:putative DNA methylase
MRESSAGRGAPTTQRKLIEVALPLEVINRESVREKSIRHGHPSTLHLWWARRPLAAARAVLFAQLVDDPSSHPDRFPTAEAQRAERERLHEIIERLVVWENSGDQALLDQAHQEILKSTDGNPPPILDPFAGGGTIPLEAQRLGLEAHASDLNPVAVLINKALIEIPPRFAGHPPVFPGLAGERLEWREADGLAADVRAYGEWMRNAAEARIGPHYPRARLNDDGPLTVIAWLWARTVTCPNPACAVDMPLVRSWWLSKKAGSEVWAQPIVVADSKHASGKRVEFEIRRGTTGAPRDADDGTMGRSGARCVVCGSAVPLSHIRNEGKAGRMGAQLMATVADGDRQRLYLRASLDQEEAAKVGEVGDVPDGELPANPRNFNTPGYGLSHWADLFTSRQLLALTTFSDLVLDARERVVRDARAGGATSGASLESGGEGAEAYADAVATYLGMVVSAAADDLSSIVTWRSSHGTGASRSTFSRQALPMTWDFVELNPFAGSAGDLATTSRAVSAALARAPVNGPKASVTARDAIGAIDGSLISTDPPYYDNINYSDLSDYFYVWLRRSLRQIYPDLLSTMQVPKAEELVANPYRHGGKEGAKEFFEDGFRRVFQAARKTAWHEYPITVYYAFKQSAVDDDGASSTGWETLLDGMIHSGWAITATWPLRSEKGGRMLSVGTNALASSIVLALRPRPEGAPSVDRRSLIAALHDELPDALRRLQQGAIAPVDLPQAAIGPGMAVFSRYSRVMENDGSTMTVRSALARINEILDQVLNEQEGDFDNATRFAIAWYRQYGYLKGDFGAADNIARARNTSVETMVHEGILTTAAGKVELLAPDELSEEYDVLNDDRVGVWEVLHHLIAHLERGGLPWAGEFLQVVEIRPDAAVDVELVKELAFLLFSIAEKNGWTQDALAFNTVATAWPDIVDAARAGTPAAGTQTSFDLEEG